MLFRSERFRSERPGSQHFEEVAKAVAEAHKKAIPFFQNAFGLEPGINALIFAHRTQRSLKLYDLGHKVLLEPDDLLRMMVSMRPVARHSKGVADIQAVDTIVLSILNRALLRKSVEFIWEPATKLIRRFLGL